MEEENGGPSAPSPKKLKMESEEEAKELSKDEDHSEEKSKEFKDEDEDGPSSGWQQSPPLSPPLLDMTDFPPSSPLPPTPPLPSSPRDIDMEQPESEDDGPPPGWDNKYQLTEQTEQLVKPAAILASFSDTQTEDARQDAQNEEREPRSQAHPSPPPDLASSDLGMEHQDSEDDGPPPGWDNKYRLTEQAAQIVTPAAASVNFSDIQAEDVKQDALNEEEPRSQAHLSPPSELGPSDIMMEDALQDCRNENGQPTLEVPSAIKVDQEDSKDEGPPPGWDSKRQPKPNLQMSCPTTHKSDVKVEDVRQDGESEGQQTAEVSSDTKVDLDDSEDEGPPPGWDAKCEPKPNLQQEAQNADVTDIKTGDLEKEAWNENVSQLQSWSHPGPAAELVPSVEEQDSEDDGPPPGWNSKCQSKPNLQMACPAAPQSDMKTDDLQEEARNENGPQQQSHSHPSLAPELVPSGMKVEEQDSDDDGPPPGWDSKCLPQPNLQQGARNENLADIKTEDLQQEARNEDGPQSQSQSHPSSPPELVPCDIKVEEKDSEDDGPPPGWDSKCQSEPNLLMARPTTPSSDLKMEKDQEDDEGPPPGWGSTPQEESQVHSSLPSGMGCEPNNVKIVEESPPPPLRQQSLPSTKPQISMPKPPPITNYPEMGQMVCGSCRHLLSYPRGARYVECACCLEENYVLEEHEVGQVVCGGCNVLLMYPYGAHKVRCANCSAETEIGDQNRRPTLSEHKRRARQQLKRVQAS